MSCLPYWSNLQTLSCSFGLNKISQKGFLPSLYRVAAEANVEWVRKNIEALIVGVGSVRLKLEFVVEWLPVLSVNDLGLDENAILLCWEIGSSNDLANEIHRCFEISFSAGFKRILSREVHIPSLCHNSNYFKF